jgi:hypothetical protein
MGFVFFFRLLICSLLNENVSKTKFVLSIDNGKAIFLQARKGLEGFRRMRVPDLKAIST